MIDKTFWLFETVTGYALDFEPGRKRPLFVPVDDGNGRLAVLLLVISIGLLAGWMMI